MADFLRSQADLAGERRAEEGRALAADAARLAEDLELGLSVDGDRPLRAWLRRQAASDDQQPLFVRIGAPQVWAELSGGKTRLHRTPPKSGASLDLIGRLVDDPQARAEVASAARRLGAPARASALLGSLFDRATDPTRHQIATLLAWSPLLEHGAYRFSTRSTSVLFNLRRGTYVRGPSASQLARPNLLSYWRLLMANAHVGLIAASTDARAWLIEMSRTFTWVDWTPSRAFVQERGLWFSAVGARHAAAFGAEVVEPYLRILALAGHPMRAFDAALGLAAIGLSEPQVIPALEQELATQAGRFGRQGSRDSAMNARIVESALLCLRDPDRAAASFRQIADPPGVRLNGNAGLLSRPAVHLDATASVESVGYLGLLALPWLLKLSTPDFYQPRSPRLAVAALGPAEIAAHIARAWTPGGGAEPQLH